MDSFQHDGLAFDVSDSGPAGGEPIVLLHGFPQTSAAWSGLTPALADAGLRVLAPDQRGYSPGARPTDRAAYRMDALTGDVLALLDAAGVDRAHIVGHDWGGAVAWALAAGHPDRVRTLTALSTPHPRALARSMLTSTQALRSAYVAFFQLPALPERVLLARDAAVLRQVLERTGLDAALARRYAERLAEPGALTAALNWYRALGRSLTGDVAVPTLYIWSTRDTALGRPAAEGTAQCVKGPYRFEVLEGAGHWIPEEAADQVAPLLLRHVGVD